MTAYSLLYGLALILLLPLEFFRRPRSLRTRWLRERLGRIDLPAAPPGPCVWIHAVSVGEVIAAGPLVKAMKQRHPWVRIVLSTVTDTGQEVARSRLGSEASVIYVPFDLPFTVRRAMTRVSPSLFLIMETELWPNMITIMRKASVPVLLLNGRISEKSFRGYQRLGFFMRSMLDGVSLFCMQDEVYADRIRRLGAPSSRVTVTGNFKFDTRPAAPVPEWAGHLSQPVIVAGSTHRGEEDLILDACAGLREDFPGLTLVIAPRHPERFREVEELVDAKGLRWLRRSDMGRSDAPSCRQGMVVVLDVMGELASVYGCAAVAVVGGSFIRHGGQNPLEPAYWSKPVVCGLHMENFPFVEEFYAEHGALRTEAAGLTQVLRRILSQPDLAASMGQASRRVYEENAGAVERTLREVERFLPAAAEGRPKG